MLTHLGIWFFFGYVVHMFVCNLRPGRGRWSRPSVAATVRGSRILTSYAYCALVRRAAAMNERSIRVHQLREKDVESGRPMQDVLPELLHFVGSRPLVGYWIDFDVRMLDKYLIEHPSSKSAI